MPISVNVVRGNRMLTRLLLALAVVCAAGPALAADWPAFRGPNADGISPEMGIRKDWSVRPPRLLWKVALTDDGYAGPSVAGGRVFIVDHAGTRDVVRALDLATGRERWRSAYADTAKRLYGFARATPAVADGRVYTLSRLGLAHCLNAATGKKLWARDLVAEFRGVRPQWDYAPSPLVDGERVILCPGGPGAAVVALDRRTGKTLWKGGGSDAPGYATPILARIGGRKQVVVFAGAALLGVDPNRGRLLWRFPWTTALDPKVDTPSARGHLNANAAAPVPIGDALFITTGYGHGSALVEVSGSHARTRWESTEMQSQYTSPILLGGHLYCTSDPNRLVCLDPRSGRPLWRQTGFDKGGLVAVDGVVIVVEGRRGDVVMVSPSPDRYRELGRFRPLGGESRTAPIVSGGKLLVRNRHALACLDLR